MRHKTTNPKLPNIASLPGITIAICLYVLNASGATLKVTSLADSGPGTLRAALAGGADGDSIDGAGVSGTILLTSGELEVNRSVSIVGPGSASLAIDGNAASRVFHISSNTVVRISGLVITNGVARTGGGILSERGTLTISNCAVVGNSAWEHGGGIYSVGSAGGSAVLRVIGSTFSGNFASSGNGGAIYNNGYLGSATLTMVDCTVNGNHGLNAGGIENDGGEASLVGSTVSGNDTTGNGGGIDNLKGTLTIAHTVISGNHGFVGGGINNEIGTLTVLQSTVRGNIADDSGGGVENAATRYSATAWIGDSVISGNSARIGGGVHSFASGIGTTNGVVATLTITNCALAGNTGTNSGGGIFNRRYGASLAEATVGNCIFSNNLGGGTEGADMDNGGGGGIYNAGGNVHVGNSTFLGNEALLGGAINNDASGAEGTSQLYVAGSTLVVNGASSGGAINNLAGAGTARAYIFNSTLSSNFAQFGFAGAIRNFGGETNEASVQILNCTLSGNVGETAGWGAAILNAGTMEMGGTIITGGQSFSPVNSFPATSLGFNLLSDAGDRLLKTNTDLIYIDPMLGPLQDNGGSTFTHALLCGSLAIDAGKNFSGSAFDQRGPGFIRTFDDPVAPNAFGGDGTDIGAYEVQRSCSTPTQALQHLLDLVNSSAGHAQPLRASLYAALASLDGNNPGAAVNQLEAFQNKVQAQVTPFDPALAQIFIQAARAIIDLLRTR